MRRLNGDCYHARMCGARVDLWSKCTSVAAEGSLTVREIGVVEAIAVYGLSGFQRYRSREHRTGVDAGMELPVFAAGVYRGREICQEFAVKIATSKGGIELTGIYADHPCAKTAGDHLYGEVGSGNLPEGK